MNDENNNETSHILVVEDDAEIANLLVDAIGASGMKPAHVRDGRAMHGLLRKQAFDLVMLDVMLPGEDGISICRNLRQETTIPIILLTALGEEIDRIVGLEVGADDYITKPFSTREVIARIRSLLRRAAYGLVTSGSQSVFRFEGWRLDPVRRQLHDPNHTRISLTTTEFDLLVAFCQNPGRVISREELLAFTHTGLAGPIERTVDVHISRLRQKIEDDPKEPVFLRTVRLGGYVFTASVERER